MSQWGCCRWDLRCTPPPCGSSWILQYYGPVASWCYCNFSIGFGATRSLRCCSTQRRTLSLGLGLAMDSTGRIFTAFLRTWRGVHWITHNGPVAWLSEGISFVQIDFYLSRSLGVIRSELESVLSKGTFQRLRFPQISWI